MDTARSTSLASGIVFFTGVFWGLYWIPVRALEALGLAGASGTAAIAAAAVLLLLPAAVARRRHLAAAPPLALAAIALGGAAFALYSIGFLYGRVAILILLYFLTPVWSTLIGRYVMGWETPPMRLAAIAVGLGGLAVMLSAGGSAPVPRSLGEWMGLAAGILWSVSTTGIRARSTLRPPEAAFVFALGATLTALALAPVLPPGPAPAEGGSLAAILGLALVTGGLWWALSVSALMWATLRLDPARVGILLMTEVLVGAATAALLAGERLSPVELAGGALVLLAGLLELWPLARGRRGAA